MPWYLGRPGSILQLPAPSRGTQTPYERLGATHQLLSGGRVRDSSGVKRSWQFTWQALTRDQVGILDGFAYRTYGPGPYVLVDPEQRNLLSPNQSSGTDVTASTVGWGTFGAMTLISSTDTALTGIRSLFVQWNTAMAPGAAGADTNGPVAPVIGGATYTGRFNTYYGGGTASFTVACILIWYDATKTYITENAGTAVQPLANWSVAATCTAAAPSNAAYCAVRVTNAIATTTSTAIYTDGWQLEQASSANLWVPGLGAPYVTVDGGGRGRQLNNQNDYSLTLVEL